MFVSPTLMYAVKFVSLLIAIKTPEPAVCPDYLLGSRNSSLVFDLFTPVTKIEIIIPAG
jgi:hypothetical protein